MKTISVRQLLREPKKYLKPGRFILTRHGKGIGIVEIVSHDLDKEKTAKVLAGLAVDPKFLGKVDKRTAAEVQVMHKFDGKYGCGCKKVEGKSLCPKHSRL